MSDYKGQQIIRMNVLIYFTWSSLCVNLLSIERCSKNVTLAQKVLCNSWIQYNILLCVQFKVVGLW